tara:strand:- start:1689 stop:3347 length:1659 start_codon:yes stop_codon:yes gene_type:complete
VNEALHDFRNFLFLCWKHLNLPDPTPVQYDIADFVQNGPKRRVIQAFRGVGKSWITSAYVCHQLLLDPTKNILVVSASKTRSDDFSTFTLRLINDMSILEHLRPKDEQRNSKIAFDVGPAPASHAPSVVSKGIFSQITGSRADLIIADDVESLNNSATQMMRDKLLETVKEFDAVLKPDGHIIYLGTPQTEMSIYTSLSERGYSLRVWPARIPSEGQESRMGPTLAPMIKSLREDSEAVRGDAVDPARFNDADLLEREASYGRTGFALQFMLDSTLSDLSRYPLRLSDLLVMNLSGDMGPEKLIWAPDRDRIIGDVPCVGMSGDRYYTPFEISNSWQKFTGSVLAIDPSGRGADETAYAVVKMLNGYLFVTDAGGIEGGYDDKALRKLAEIAKAEQVNKVLIESNFGDGMFTALLTPVLAKTYKVSIEEVRHSTQKERRIIDTLEPVLNQHKLVINRKVIEQDYDSTRHLPPEKALKYQLFYQMSRITRSKGALAHDDRLDVLAMAVNYWTEQMSQDVDRQMATRKEELLKRDLENFMDTVVGRKPSPHKWF